MFEFITVKEICTELKYKDRRSVCRWCRNHNVKVISFSGSNRKVVLRDEFEKAISNILNRQMLFVQPIYHGFSESGCKYIPQGNIESRFLSILQNLSATL